MHDAMPAGTCRHLPVDLPDAAQSRPQNVPDIHLRRTAAIRQGRRASTPAAPAPFSDGLQVKRGTFSSPEFFSRIPSVNAVVVSDPQQWEAITRTRSPFHSFALGPGPIQGKADIRRRAQPMGTRITSSVGCFERTGLSEIAPTKPYSFLLSLRNPPGFGMNSDGSGVQSKWLSFGSAGADLTAAGRASGP